jgi:REP element-mobilizing transposase RayT
MLNRRSIRLKNYDYSQEGKYFITICCQDRASLFGKIDNGEMILNEAGNMIITEWLALKNRFPHIELDEYIVMPNHFHGILGIVNQNAFPPTNNTVGTFLAGVQNNKNGQPQEKGQPQGFAPTELPTVGQIIGAFKSITSVEYIRGIESKNWEQFNKRLWQRNYWEHIIRNDGAFDRISEYIQNNPRKWNEDKLN